MLATPIIDATNFRHRVLIITQNLPVPFDRSIWQKATELSRNGYVVSVICPKAKDYASSYEKLEDIHIFRHTSAPRAKSPLGYALEHARSLAWEFILTCKIFFSVGFDAIHACNPPDNIFFIGGFFKLFFSKRFLFDLRAGSPELHETRFRRRDLFHSIAQSCERLALKTADVCIVPNQSYHEIVLGRSKMSTDDIFVVRPGPDLKRIMNRSSVPNLKNGRKFVVGYLGAIESQESLHYLIEAARILLQDKKRRDIQWLVIGDGPGLEGVKKRVAIEGLTDYITFMGHMPDDAMFAALGTCDICVCPDEVNLVNENACLSKVTDYMALGKPVVQFDMKEGRLTAGDAALYAKPNDAQDFAECIVALVNDPAKRKAMCEAGRAHVEDTLAWSFQAPRLLAAYERLFKKR